jgi:hypothetical protein
MDCSGASGYVIDLNHNTSAGKLASVTATSLYLAAVDAIVDCNRSCGTGEGIMMIDYDDRLVTAVSSLQDQLSREHTV